MSYLLSLMFYVGSFLLEKEITKFVRKEVYFYNFYKWFTMQCIKTDLERCN